METYNLDKLVKIEILNERLDDFYSYKKEIKFLGITIRSEGFYSILHDYYEDCPTNYFLKDGKVFLKSRVLLRFTNESTVFFFNTYDEALNFHNQLLLKSYRWIKDGKLTH
jgi:homospermidine synthase